MGLQLTHVFGRLRLSGKSSPDVDDQIQKVKLCAVHSACRKTGHGMISTYSRYKGPHVFAGAWRAYATSMEHDAINVKKSRVEKTVSTRD